MIGPKLSAEIICKNAKHIAIDREAVKSLASKIVSSIKDDRSYIHYKAWKTHPLNPKIANEAAIQWIFLVDALNFSFWTPAGVEKFSVTYGGSSHTGYWSLCAAVNRAIDEGIPITSPEYCRDFTEQQAKNVFRSDNDTSMPLIKERVEVMNEIGSALIDKFDGKFSNCIKQANGSAQTLLKLVTDNFPCFRDEAVFEGQRVSFYKRAQILIADLWACFEGKDAGSFDDVDSITMFADYRIPQTLAYFNVLSYSKELTLLLEKDHMFKSGDLMEMEIRAASIWSVELLCETINSMLQKESDIQGVKVNAILLDHFLWDYRRKHDEETKHIPYHKIRCIFY